MIKYSSMMLILLCGFVTAQNWQTVNIDTFRVDEQQVLISSKNSKMGLAWRNFNLPDSINEFYVQADIFYKTVPKAKLFFLFGVSKDSSFSFLASGYDFRQKKIVLGKIAFWDSTTVNFEQLASKNVEIHDYRPLYVYRIITNKQKETIQAEVNGVPMLVYNPDVKLGYQLLGFLISGGTAQLEKFRVVYR